MGQLGYSYVGFIFLVMLIVPNFVWTRYKPEGYSTKNENIVLLTFERIGQVSVICSALMFTNFNIDGWSAWSLWLVAAVILMLMYECWWVRYFKSEKTLKDFYSSYFGIPLAGAVLPVTAFFLLGIYGKVLLLVVASLILGVGHVGIHAEHLREIQ
ncbi:MAG: hypothetical protein Q4F66_08850 [Clostridium sp.]|nr:hypothetical protein [Clostridium sp.]